MSTNLLVVAPGVRDDFAFPQFRGQPMIVEALSQYVVGPPTMN